MTHDLVIRNGTVVDGSGTPSFEGDVAIDGDTISAVGKVDAGAHREIDAEGRAVTPGFVDLHTHFDAQAGWDPMLTPVSWHGVTTALFGNCGVTFAPCKPADREFLAGMMETVEDIPKDAILNGLSWEWESYGEYLDAIEKLDPAINITGLVGHCASRFFVMGERAITDDATAEEIEEIAALVGRSVREGAVGFSSNRLPGHVLPDGRSIPGTFAKEEELVAIAQQVGAAGGIVQNVLNYAKLDEEMAIVESQCRAAGTRILFSAPFMEDTDGRLSYQQSIGSMQADGLDVNGLTMPRSGGFLSGLKTDVLFHMAATNLDRQIPSFGLLRGMDFDARLAAIRDAGFRAKLIDEAQGSEPIDTSNYYWIGGQDRPDYTKPSSESLASLATAAGKHPVELWLDKMLETDGEGFFHARFFNVDLDKLQPFLKEDWLLPGIGDAGAHVSQIMDSGWTSFLLSHWVRDNDLFTLEEAVRRMTSAPARVLGFADRGTLAPGLRADVNVIDLERVAERQPELVHDFPGGAPRFIQRAVGYEATVCNGQVILEADEHTGARAGRVLRNPNS